MNTLPLLRLLHRVRLQQWSCNAHQHRVNILGRVRHYAWVAEDADRPQKDRNYMDRLVCHAKAGTGGSGSSSMFMSIARGRPPTTR